MRELLFHLKSDKKELTIGFHIIYVIALHKMCKAIL